MKSYTTVVPPARFALTETVEIGFEHDVEVAEDGTEEVVLRLDADGNPIKRRYTVPAKLTLAQLWTSVRRLGEDRIAQFGQDPFADTIDILDAIIGGDIVTTVAADRTVADQDYVAFVAELGAMLGIDDLLGDGAPN